MVDIVGWRRGIQAFPGGGQGEARKCNSQHESVHDCVQYVHSENSQ